MAKRVDGPGKRLLWKRHQAIESRFGFAVAFEVCGTVAPRREHILTDARLRVDDDFDRLGERNEVLLVAFHRRGWPYDIGSVLCDTALAVVGVGWDNVGPFELGELRPPLAGEQKEEKDCGELLEAA